MLTIGLIGYGRFGQFLAARLARWATVAVYDSRRAVRREKRTNITFRPLSEVASQRVVILAVPVSSLRKVLRAMRGHLRGHPLVIDVCAVKTGPIRWMMRLLPESTSILGTHPLFGPDSASKSVRGMKIVLCPARVAPGTLQPIMSLLHRKGVETLIMDPEDHDRMMADTILLTQYVGRLVDHAGFTRWPAVTKNYSNLLSIVDIVRHDTTVLFDDMVRHNVYGRDALRRLQRAARELRGPKRGAVVDS